jgi:hypothetical protein
LRGIALTVNALGPAEFFHQKIREGLDWDAEDFDMDIGAAWVPVNVEERELGAGVL